MSTSRFVIGATTLLVAASLVACAPMTSAAPTAQPTSVAPIAAVTPTATPTTTATPTPSAAAGISLPDDCTEIYSATMLASLEAQIPPLNDPGVTMYSTEDATLLESLDALPTLRCSWGEPSEVGLATNVTLVDDSQSDAIAAALVEAGYGCGDEGDATVCRIEQRGVSLDDTAYTRGETHALRGNVWVSTSWLNFSPDGYTEDILATLAE